MGLGDATGTSRSAHNGSGTARQAHHVMNDLFSRWPCLGWMELHCMDPAVLVLEGHRVVVAIDGVSLSGRLLGEVRV